MEKMKLLARSWTILFIQGQVKKLEYNFNYKLEKSTSNNLIPGAESNVAMTAQEKFYTNINNMSKSAKLIEN